MGGLRCGRARILRRDGKALMNRSKNSLNPRKPHRGKMERRWKRRKKKQQGQHGATPAGVPRAKRRRALNQPSTTYKWRP